ncbi:MAG: phosphotransferase [Polyangiales bacterium]
MYNAPEHSEALHRWIEETLGSKQTRGDVIQSLWSGYGSLERLHFDGGGTAILKRVAPPADVDHPRGWNGSLGHARKLRSYEAECAFYARWARECGDACRVPRALGINAHEGGWWMLLEDLDAAGFEGRPSHPSPAERDACLRWLANFHARFLGVAPDGLWPTGTYWHLATRPDELRAMAEGPLRRFAADLDARLSSARFATFVHGDAKVANFCFGVDEVAAVDFQYAGGGCGMKDVAYFLSSVFSETECEAHAASCLDVYFHALRSAVPRSVDGDALEKEWRGLYPFAWADFHRFLAGWAPSHAKVHGYTARMSAEAIATLGRALNAP